MNIKQDVRMHNEVRKYLNATLKRIDLTPFLNKKLIKVDNTLIRKAHQLIEWPQGIKAKLKGFEVQIDMPYLRAHTHDLTLHVRLCFRTTKTCKYVSETFNIAGLNHRVLTNINTTPLPILSTTKEATLYTKALKLRAAAQEAASSLSLYEHREAVRR